jgi:viologen exporter family transport system permease protein
MSAWLDALAPYAEFSRVGFVNILAFRLRYFTGIVTYTLNVTIYYFIWSAVYHPGQSIAGYNLPQMITYVSVGWIIRSFYTNTIDQEMAYEVIDGKIAMDLIKPVSVQWMWICRAMGESAFRLGLLTLPTAVLVAFVFPVHGPASPEDFLLFLVAVLGSFFLMGAINFMIGTCAIPLKSILALIRAKFWLIELLSGLLIPMAYFPDKIREVLAWLPFEHIAYTPLQIYLGKFDHAHALRALATQWFWVAALLVLADLWWTRSVRKLSIQGG